MVTKPPRKTSGGWLQLDLAIAMALIVFAVLPLAFSFAHERKLTRIYYTRAIAGQIVDGELERLAAGEWRRFEPGVHPYTVTAAAAANLPPGNFQLAVRTNFLQLEWIPARANKGGRITRRAPL